MIINAASEKDFYFVATRNSPAHRVTGFPMKSLLSLSIIIHCSAMKKKIFSILICLSAILVFCSFYNPAKDNSRVTFSAKIESTPSGYISIHTSLKNNTSDTIGYYLESCNPQNCFFSTDKTYLCSNGKDCEGNWPILHKIAPNAIIENYPFCSFNSSIGPHQKFRIGFNFIPVDMVKDTRINPLSVHNIIWSDTLEIK
jgi:hypothetical protein